MWLSLLVVRVSQPRLVNICSVDKWTLFKTILPARLCRHSRPSSFPLPHLWKKAPQKSKIGRIIDLNNLFADSIVNDGRALEKIPSILETLFFTWSICWFIERLLSNITPRYLKASQYFRDSPPKAISIASMPWRHSLCCVPKIINSVFFKFRRSLFPLSHSERLVSSIFNFSSTSMNCAEEKKLTVSSAYMITLEKLMHDGRSLIYNVNNTGPRMLPWGTPFSTARGLDKLVPNDTTWDLLDRYAKCKHFTEMI